MPTDEHRWPCESCGADLRYVPGQTELKCDHCGHAQQIAAAAAPSRSRALTEYDLAKGLQDDLPLSASEDLRSSHCPNCGAVVEFQTANHASACPFCDTPVVIDTGSHRRLKPQALVPFALTETQAREALMRWLGRLWFAPNSLLAYTRAGRAMTGVYAPFWTFDAASETRYHGQRGEHYYETRTVNVTVNGKTERREEKVQKTRWHPASGKVVRDFDDVLVMASSSLPRRLGADLTPWDLATLVPYSPDYLAGFQAEGYTVQLSDANSIAHQEMAQVIATDVRRDIGGDVQRIDTIDTNYSEETFKHILLPIWTAAYKYSNKSYRFLVNGQTGEVQGERPYSWWKISFAVAGVAILVGAALYLNDPSMFG